MLHAFYQKHETQLKISPGQSWITLRYIKTIHWVHHTGPRKGA